MQAWTPTWRLKIVQRKADTVLNYVLPVEEHPSGTTGQLFLMDAPACEGRNSKLCIFTSATYFCQHFLIKPTYSNNLIPDASLDTNMEAEDSVEESRHSFELRPSRGGASIRNDWTIAPEGVFCQRPDIYRKKLPEIPDHFSVKIETIDKVLIQSIVPMIEFLSQVCTKFSLLL